MTAAEQGSSGDKPKSYRDRVTGLKNYDWLDDHLPEILRNRPEESNEPGIGILMIDLDGFKDINDTLGHAAGDKYLLKVGEILDEHTRHDREDLKQPDTVRRSGDEFIVIIYGVHNEAGLKAAEDRIQLALEETGVQASIGAVIYENETAEEFLDKADQAMYAVKNSRKEAKTTPEDWEIIGKIGELAASGSFSDRDLPALLRIHRMRQTLLESAE